MISSRTQPSVPESGGSTKMPANFPLPLALIEKMLPALKSEDLRAGIIAIENLSCFRSNEQAG